MTGSKKIEVYDNKIHYLLDLKRSVTVISGDSGNGKTTLVTLLSDWYRDGRKSGVHCISDAPVVVFTNATKWNDVINNTKNSIIVIDENVEYTVDVDFASQIQNSSNYILIISRSGKLTNFAFSINSLMKLAENGKEHWLEPMYELETVESSPNAIICEDSNSGREFLELAFSCEIDPACGNANVNQRLSDRLEQNDALFTFVDGSAYGAFIKRTLTLQKIKWFNIFAPESFEYLLLNIKAFKSFIKDEIEHTEYYCDSTEFKTWERYYNHLLNQCMMQKFRTNYSKKKLSDFFKNDSVISEVAAMFPIAADKYKEKKKNV